MVERALEKLPDETLINWLKIATDRRMGAVIEAFRRGWSIERVYEITRITRWFLYGFEKIAKTELETVNTSCLPKHLSAEQLRRWKSLGFSDAHIESLNGLSERNSVGVIASLILHDWRNP